MSEKRKNVDRRTVDLSAYPDLVVIYLGMRVNTLAGLKTLLGFGPKIAKSAAALPDGLLLHEGFFWSLFPMHGGMRQYWRDFESLERWARSEPHRIWWQNFMRPVNIPPFAVNYVLSNTNCGFTDADRRARKIAALGKIFLAADRIVQQVEGL